MLFLNKIKRRHAEGRHNGFASCYYRVHSVTTGPKAAHDIIYKCNWKLGVWYFFHWDTISPFHPSKSVIPRLFMPVWQSLVWPSVERSRSLLQIATTGVLLSWKPLFFGGDKKVRVLILIHRSQVWSYSVTSAEVQALGKRSSETCSPTIYQLTLTFPCAHGLPEPLCSLDTRTYIFNSSIIICRMSLLLYCSSDIMVEAAKRFKSRCSLFHGALSLRIDE